MIDNNARTRVADLRMRSLPYLRADTAMYDLLKLFQTGRSHMVVLTKPPDAADGTVSRANSQDVTVQIEEAKERVSPEVNVLHADGSVAVQAVEAPEAHPHISASCIHPTSGLYLLLVAVEVGSYWGASAPCALRWHNLLHHHSMAVSCLKALLAEHV